MSLASLALNESPSHEPEDTSHAALNRHVLIEMDMYPESFLPRDSSYLTSPSSLTRGNRQCTHRIKTIRSNSARYSMAFYFRWDTEGHTTVQVKLRHTHQSSPCEG